MVRLRPTGAPLSPPPLPPMVDPTDAEGPAHLVETPSVWGQPLFHSGRGLLIIICIYSQQQQRTKTQS